MVRPECYQCAVCARSWTDYFPGLTCRCGSDAVRRSDGEVLSAGPRVAAAPVVRLDLDDLDDQAPVLWSPYPLGNGCEGVAL